MIRLSPILTKAGSSPCVWGTVFADCAAKRQGRFIPMRVGNGLSKSRSLIISAVHPHACGERFANLTVYIKTPGSSPCVWGTGLDALLMADNPRFIPMRVGNGGLARNSSGCSPVHPHACGERAIEGGEFCGGDGSSPCVWGTVRKSHRVHKDTRFIPMRVGNGRKDKL